MAHWMDRRRFLVGTAATAGAIVVLPFGPASATPEAMAEAIFKKWELDFAVIGEVTDTGHMVLTCVHAPDAIAALRQIADLCAKHAAAHPGVACMQPLCANATSSMPRATARSRNGAIYPRGAVVAPVLLTSTARANARCGNA